MKFEMSVRTRQRTLFYVAIALIVAITAGGNMLCGRLGRGQSAMLHDAADRLQTLPKEIGDWRCTQEQPLADRVVEMLQCSGFVARTYVHNQTGRSVHLTLLVGPAGPMTVHRPEVCLPSREWEALGKVQKCPMEANGGESDEFFRCDFAAQTLSGQRVRIYYGWNRGDRWQAPDSPRIALGDASGLFKLQVNVLLPGGESVSDDPALEFLRDLLPVLEQNCLARKDGPGK